MLEWSLFNEYAVAMNVFLFTISLIESLPTAPACYWPIEKLH